MKMRNGQIFQFSFLKFIYQSSILKFISHWALDISHQ